METQTKSPTMKLMKGVVKKEQAPTPPKNEVEEIEQEVEEAGEEVAEETAEEVAEEVGEEEEQDLAKPVQKEKVKVKVKVKEKPDTTSAPSVEDDLIVNVAHQVENLKEEKAFKLVPQLLDSIDKDYFMLGGVLSSIQAQGWYMDKSYENFRAYVETECGIQYRKAMYLISIYNGLVNSGVSWSKVSDLGWTKLKELAGILSPENVDEWVGYAKDMTTLQLQEYIKQKSANAVAGGDAPTTQTAAKVDEIKKSVTTMTFKVHPDQKETVKAALDKAKHETGTTVDTVALEHIALDFLSGTKLKSLPTLKELMTGKSAEEVLEVFGEVFPNVALEATLPDE